jgi:hypothetical protein
VNYRGVSFSLRPLYSRLLGVTPSRTLVGVGYLVVLAVVVTTSTVAARSTVSGVPIVTLTPAFNSLFWALIVLVVLSTFAVPVGYALFNGGPALAFLIAVAPELVVLVTTGMLHLTPDFALGLAFGAFAAALAVYVTGYRVHGSLSPGSHADLDDAVLFATAVTVVAVVGLARLYVEGPASMAVRTEPYGVVVPTVGMVAHCWLTRFRTE